MRVIVCAPGSSPGGSQASQCPWGAALMASSEVRVVIEQRHDGPGRAPESARPAEAQNRDGSSTKQKSYQVVESITAQHQDPKRVIHGVTQAFRVCSVG